MKKQILLFLALIMSMMATAQVTIQMEKEGGVYKVPCTVNGVKMKFVFDTGAATVCISQSMAQFLLDGDYLSVDDIVGTGRSLVADGSLVNHVEIVLRDIEIGGMHLRNVKAIVTEGQNAPLLLGQTAICELGSVTIEGNRLVIHSAEIELTEEQIERLEQQLQKYLESDSYAAAIECLERIDLLVGLTEYGLYELCYCYFQNQQFDQCIQTGNNWINLYGLEGDKFYKCSVFQYIAGSYRFGKEDMQKALLYYQKALYVSDNEFDDSQIDIFMSTQYSIYYSIGDCYLLLDDLNKAFNSFSQAFDNRSVTLNVTGDDIKKGKIRDEKLGDCLYSCSAIKFKLGDRDLGEYLLTLSAKCGNGDAKAFCRELGLRY